MRCLGISKKIAIVSGFGESDTSKLNAFDNALINAGINDCNLIKVSSILAKNTKIIKKFKLEKGSFVPCVMSVTHSEKNNPKTAGVGIALNNQGYGYAMEAQGTTKKEAEEEIKNKLTEMAKNRNQKILKTQIITKEAQTTKKYGCAIATVVYLF